MQNEFLEIQIIDRKSGEIVGIVTTEIVTDKDIKPTLENVMQQFGQTQLIGHKYKIAWTIDRQNATSQD